MKLETIDGRLHAIAESVEDVVRLVTLPHTKVGEVSPLTVTTKRKAGRPRGGWKNRACPIEGCEYIGHSGRRSIAIHVAMFHKGGARKAWITKANKKSIQDAGFVPTPSGRA